MGKTSVIKQLPIRLGSQVIPVEIDLQAVSIAENVSGFLVRIGELITKGCEDKRIRVLPPVYNEVEKDPYLVFQHWLEDLESALENKWLLLAIDEYEMFGDLLKQNRVDERIFYLLRSLCQHHPKIILLFSGAHTLEDLPAFWSNYFVNVKILRVQGLNESDARELIVKPIPEFNLEYDPGSIDKILSATGCQPYLLQLVCRDLVNSLNDSRKLKASVSDVDNAFASALIGGMAYFNDLYNGNDSDDTQRSVLNFVAKTESVTYENIQKAINLQDLVLDESLRHLVHRDILRRESKLYQFQIDLVRQWILKKTLL